VRESFSPGRPAMLDSVLYGADGSSPSLSLDAGSVPTSITTSDDGVTADAAARRVRGPVRARPHALQLLTGTDAAAEADRPSEAGAARHAREDGGGGVVVGSRLGRGASR